MPELNDSKAQRLIAFKNYLTNDFTVNIKNTYGLDLFNEIIEPQLEDFLECLELQIEDLVEEEVNDNEILEDLDEEDFLLEELGIITDEEEE